MRRRAMRQGTGEEVPLGRSRLGGAKPGVPLCEEAPAGEGPLGVDPAKPLFQKGAGGAALEEAAWEVGVVLTLLEEGQAPRAFLKEARLLKGGEVGEEGQGPRGGRG
jgi:hypothetical protein